MRWSILTPDECVHWDDGQLRFTAGVAKEFAKGVAKEAGRTAPAARDADRIEDLWREYYRSTFNPARVNEGLMRQHMPKHLWQNLPEADTIREALATSAQRVEQMLQDKAPRRTK
jgi:DNA polymerase